MFWCVLLVGRQRYGFSYRKTSNFYIKLFSVALYSPSQPLFTTHCPGLFVVEIKDLVSQLFPTALFLVHFSVYVFLIKLVIYLWSLFFLLKQKELHNPIYLALFFFFLFSSVVGFWDNERSYNHQLHATSLQPKTTCFL